MRTRLLSLAGCALILAMLALNIPSSTKDTVIPVAHAAAVDYFLKIDGIDGESTDDQHKGEIDLQSWSWGESQPGLVGGTSASGGGGGAGKVSVHDMHFRKTVDKATPTLMVSTATGQHYPSATLTVRKAGGQQMEYFKVKLTDVLISSYQAGGTQGSVPTDSFSLNFAKIRTSFG